jgi:hypothetical protein
MRFDFDFHDPVSLYPGKKTQHTLNRRLVLFPRPSGSFREEENLLVLLTNEPIFLGCPTRIPDTTEGISKIFRTDAGQITKIINKRV